MGVGVVDGFWFWFWWEEEGGRGGRVWMLVGMGFILRKPGSNWDERDRLLIISREDGEHHPAAIQITTTTTTKQQQHTLTILPRNNQQSIPLIPVRTGFSQNESHPHQHPHPPSPPSLLLPPKPKPKPVHNTHSHHTSHHTIPCTLLQPRIGILHQGHSGEIPWRTRRRMVGSTPLGRMGGKNTDIGIQFL